MSINGARRQLLLGGGLALLGSVASPAIAGLTRPNVRKLSFQNLHTGERLRIDYWIEGKYVPEALQTVNHLLRDFRTGGRSSDRAAAARCSQHAAGNARDRGGFSCDFRLPFAQDQ